MTTPDAPDPSAPAALPVRILDWLRAGYPEGVDPHDYPAVLAVLRRKLTDQEIEAIADELALSSSRTKEPIAAEDIHQLVRERAFQDASAADMFRVSARLAAGGWPLSTDI